MVVLGELRHFWRLEPVFGCIQYQTVLHSTWMLSSLPSAAVQIVPGRDVNPSFLLYCTIYWQPCGTACFSPVQKFFELFFKLWLLVLKRRKRWAHRHRSIIPEFGGQRQEDYCRLEAILAFIVRSKSTELHRETLSRTKGKKSVMRLFCSSNCSLPHVSWHLSLTF